MPAFVFRWLKGRSGTGHIRNTENPNLRVQDGLKLPWLCKDCETKFSGYETAFSNQIFHPWNNGVTRTPYQRWMLKFCVSVSWRVLEYARGRNKDAVYTDEQERLMDEANSRWRDFLNDEAAHPGKFEQHLLFFDFVESTNIEHLPNNFNRFMSGAVTFDIVGSSRSLMTFSKLGRFNIFGIIQKGPNKWDGTKINLKEGVLGTGKFTIPAGLMDLFNEKAQLFSGQMQDMSEKQRDKIDNHVLNNLDAFANSEQFEAILADASMFGKDAVIWKKPK